MRHAPLPPIAGLGGWEDVSLQPSKFSPSGQGGKEGEQEMTQGGREVQCSVNQEVLGEVGDVVPEGWMGMATRSPALWLGPTSGSLGQ